MLGPELRPGGESALLEVEVAVDKAASTQDPK